MGARFREIAIVLAVAVIVCGAVLGLDIHRLQRPANDGRRGFEPRSGELEATVPRDSSRATVAMSPEATSVSTESAAPIVAHDSAGASPARAERFQDWFDRYLRTGPDLKRLRHELEQALARLPEQPEDSEEKSAQAAIDAIRRAELSAGADYRSLMEQTEQFLDQYPHGPIADEAKTLFAKYARAWDESEFREARQFSREHPTSFAGRLARYHSYLEHHGTAAGYVSEARTAIETIRRDWGEHDYRQIHEFATTYPMDIGDIAKRVRRFLEQHPDSRHRGAGELFLTRYEKAATNHEYRVRVKSGQFAHSVGRSLSNGPDLAVEIEVGDVRLGRTPVATDLFDPIWDYEFPQRARWRLGDPVRIRVIDLDYRNRVVLKVEPAADEPLAMRFLCGTIYANGQRLVFESDFEIPTLPAP